MSLTADTIPLAMRLTHAPAPVSSNRQKGLTQQGGPPTIIRIRIRPGIAIEIRKVIVATNHAVGGDYGSCLGFLEDFINPTRILFISVIFKSICSKKPLLMYPWLRLSR